LIVDRKAQAKNVAPDALMFATRPGQPISPNNVLRRAIFPACDRLEIPRATWLTFRRIYSSWSHGRGVPGKVVAQLMGHANVDTTLNVYTQVRYAAEASNHLKAWSIAGLHAPLVAQRSGRWYADQ
jgi:integrase